MNNIWTVIHHALANNFSYIINSKMAMLIFYTLFALLMTNSFAYVFKPTIFKTIKILNRRLDSSLENVNDQLIDEGIIRKVANLAQLDISDEEVEILLPRLQEFMGFIDLIKDVDLKEGEKTSPTMKATDMFRSDSSINFDNQDNIINNFPQEEDGYLFVPRITNDESS